MIPVVHLKWGERPPVGDGYLLITRQGRIRGDDYYVHAIGAFAGEAPKLSRAEGPSFASLDSALRQAESLAAGNGVMTIYVKLEGRIAPPPFAA